MLLVPVYFLQGHASSPPPEFAISAGAVGPAGPAGPVGTQSAWLHPSRIVADASEAAFAAAPNGGPATTTATKVGTAAGGAGAGGAAAGTAGGTPAAGEAAATTTTPTRAEAPVPSVPAPPGAAPGAKAGAGATTSPTTTTTIAGLRLPLNLPINLTPVGPARKAPAHSDRGVASWFNTADATCAHRTIPFGTVVHVGRPATGASTTCTVNDWGPADTSRIIDLSMDTFEQLGHAGEGLIEVVIEW